MKTIKQIKEDKDPLTIWNAIKDRAIENMMARRFAEQQKQNVIQFETYLKRQETKAQP